MCVPGGRRCEYKGGQEVVGVAGAVGALFLLFTFLSKVGIKIIGLEDGRTWRMQRLLAA